jgi:hypothetical protein
MGSVESFEGRCCSVLNPSRIGRRMEPILVLIPRVTLKTDCSVNVGGGSLNAKAPGCNPAVGHHAMMVQVHPTPPEHES